MPESAAIVLYSFSQSRGLMYLLGMEGIADGFHYEGGRWGAFGGRKETHESLQQGCARETYEETAGCVTSYADLLQTLTDHRYTLAVHLTYKRGPFVCYFVEVPWRDYPHAFRLTKTFCQYVRAQDVNVIEKTHLKWFRHEDLMTGIRTRHRSGEESDSPTKAPHPSQFRRYNTKIPFFRHKMMDSFIALEKNPVALQALSSLTCGPSLHIDGNGQKITPLSTKDPTCALRVNPSPSLTLTTAVSSS